MNRYMLDTNMVSHLVKGHSRVGERVTAVPMAFLCVSAITVGELLFGLAKRPQATQLHVAVQEFLRRVTVFSWTDETASRYGLVRADLERKGRPLGPLDLLIATHALAMDAVLVTCDHAFWQVDGLQVEDWTE